MTSEGVTYTYRLALEALDDEGAAFGDPNGDADFPTLILPVRQWVNMGRPGVITLAPKVES